MSVYAKFRCAPLYIKKVLGIFTELITTTAAAAATTTTTTTIRVAFWDQKRIKKKILFWCDYHAVL